MNEKTIISGWSISQGDYQGDTEYNNKYTPKEKAIFNKILYFFSGALSFGVLLVTLFLVSKI